MQRQQAYSYGEQVAYVLWLAALSGAWFRSQEVKRAPDAGLLGGATGWYCMPSASQSQLKVSTVLCLVPIVNVSLQHYRKKCK